MRTDMVLDALEMARWSRGTRLDGLVATPTPAVQFTCVRYGERLAELGALPSIGIVGDCYDNALAETVNGLYKTELIRGPDQGPWRTVDDVELATLGWVHWHNTERLHGYLGDVPPAEFEAAFYAAQQTDPHRGWNPITRASTEPRAVHPSNPGRFRHDTPDHGAIPRRAYDQRKHHFNARTDVRGHQARPAIGHCPHERPGPVLRGSPSRPPTRPRDGDRIRLVTVDAATSPRALHPVPGRPGGQPRAGRSSRTDHRYTIADMADDVAGLLDAVDTHRTHLLGLSMGAMIGIEFALRHPDRLDRLILAGPGAAPARSAVDPISIWNWVKANDPSGAVFGAEQFTWLFSSAFCATSRRCKKRPPCWRATRTPSSRMRTPARLRRTLQFDALDRLGGINAPTLVIVGEQDLLTPPWVAREVADGIPGARFELVTGDGSSHVLPLERPRRLQRAGDEPPRQVHLRRSTRPQQRPCRPRGTRRQCRSREGDETQRGGVAEPEAITDVGEQNGEGHAVELVHCVGAEQHAERKERSAQRDCRRAPLLHQPARRSVWAGAAQLDRVA